jgi:hypothetical protein
MFDKIAMLVIEGFHLWEPFCMSTKMWKNHILGETYKGEFFSMNYWVYKAEKQPELQER